MGGRELRGRTVVVTRDESEDGPLSAKLKRRGAQVLLWPSVRFSPPEDPEPLRTALAQLDSYSWIIFTSARAVAAVIEVTGQLGEGNHRTFRPAAARVAAVGAGTARKLRASRWPVDLEPDEASSEAVLRVLGRNPIRDTRILFPASSLAGRKLGQGLVELGAIVDEVTAYRAESVPLSAEAARRIKNMATRQSGEITEAEAIDAVCFASPSAVQAWSEVLGTEGFAEFGRRALVTAIGSTTEIALHGAGCETVAVAREGSFLGLANIVVEGLSGVTERETRS